MFGEQLTPVASPWLLKSGPPLKKTEDLANFTLIEAGDAHHTHLEWLTWRRWFDERGLPKLQDLIALIEHNTGAKVRFVCVCMYVLVCVVVCVCVCVCVCLCVRLHVFFHVDFCGGVCPFFPW